MQDSFNILLYSLFIKLCLPRPGMRWLSMLPPTTFYLPDGYNFPSRRIFRSFHICNEIQHDCTQKFQRPPPLKCSYLPHSLARRRSRPSSIDHLPHEVQASHLWNLYDFLCLNGIWKLMVFRLQGISESIFSWYGSRLLVRCDDDIESRARPWDKPLLQLCVSMRHFGCSSGFRSRLLSSSMPQSSCGEGWKKRAHQLKETR